MIPKTISDLSDTELAAKIEAMTAAGFRPSQFGSHVTVDGNNDLLACYEEQERRKGYRTIRVTLDDGDTFYAAWSDGTHWNGWEQPCFEKSEADRFLASLLAYGVDTMMGTDSGSWARYDAAQDAYLIFDANYADDDGYGPDVYTGYDLPNGKHVYAIGAGSWCWWSPEEEQDCSLCEEPITGPVVMINDAPHCESCSDYLAEVGE